MSSALESEPPSDRENELDQARSYLRSMERMPIEQRASEFGSERHLQAVHIVIQSLSPEERAEFMALANAENARIDASGEVGSDGWLEAMRSSDSSKIDEIVDGERRPASERTR